DAEIRCPPSDPAARVEQSTGLSKLTARSCLQQRAALQAGFGPIFRGLVVLGHGRDARRKHHPRLLRRGENLNVGRHSIWLVEGSHSHEAYGIPCAPVVAPKRDAAGRAYGNLLPLAAQARRGDNHNFTGQYLDAIRFDHRVERERRSGLMLAPATMAAMNKKRPAAHAIAYMAAGASAGAMGGVDRHDLSPCSN